jgi:hypothetical protein
LSLPYLEGLNNDLNRRPVTTTPFFKEYKNYINEREVIDEADESQQKAYQTAKQKTDMTSTYKYTPLRQSWDIVGQQQSSSPNIDTSQLYQRPKSSTNFNTMTSSTSSTLLANASPRFQQTNFKPSSSHTKPHNHVTTSRSSSAASCLSLAKDTEYNGIFSGFMAKKHNISDDLDGDPVKELDSSSASVNNKKASTTKQAPANTKATLIRGNEVSSKKLSHLLKPFNNLANGSTANGMSTEHTHNSTSNVQKIKKIFS